MSARRSFGGELAADFQQYYGLDVDAVAPRRAAVLAQQLPQRSRFVRACAPAARWGDTERLLHAIEYDLRVLAWQATEDGMKGRRPPRPLPTPEDGERMRDSIEGADRERIDRILDIEGVMDDGQSRDGVFHAQA